MYIYIFYKCTQCSLLIVQMYLFNLSLIMQELLLTNNGNINKNYRQQLKITICKVINKNHSIVANFLFRPKIVGDRSNE